MNKDNTQKIKDVDWIVNVEKSLDKVLFYRAKNNQESIRLFNERIVNHKYNKIYTNLNVKGDRVFTLSEMDLLEKQKEYCDFLYPLPRNIKMIGITGTNGKTTTADFVRQLLMIKNKNVLTIGTLGVFYNDTKVDDFSLTSPNYIDLRKTIFKHAKQSTYIICEVSSHSLIQERFYKFFFDVIAWTSFSRDHLDYHETMQDYFQAKLLLLDLSLSDFIVSAKSHFVKDLKRKIIYNYQFDLINEYLKISHNKVNVDVAVGILDQLNLQVSLDELNLINPVVGRLNIIKNKEQIFIIDFAHTPDGLESVLNSLRLTYPEKAIVTLFGCGGNRDKSKRPMMGKVAENFSDFVIITSDNPRYEDPKDIAKDIEGGLLENKYKIIISREEAIEYVYNNFKSHVILLAGKGHEEYIEINGVRTFFSDRKKIEGLLNANQ